MPLRLWETSSLPEISRNENTHVYTLVVMDEKKSEKKIIYKKKTLKK